MDPRRRHLLILAGVLVLVGVALYFIIPFNKTHLGLDLQGGLEVVYKAQLRNGQAPDSGQMNQTISIMDRRINRLGVTESQVQQQGPDQISVALPGVTDVQQALTIIGQTAQLKFYDDGQTRLSGPANSTAEAVTQAKTSTLYRAGDAPELAKLAKGQTSTKLILITAPPGKYSGNQTAPVYFVYRDEPAMTGDAIKSARQAYDQQGRPDVEMDFTSQGATQFEAVTKRLATTGLLKQQPQTFAIVLDDVLESDPQVDYNENPNGISGTSAIITGTFTISEAKDLALVINTGALPVQLEKIQSQEVSATLGKDSLRQGLIAGAAGLVIVLIYLILFYRFLGLIADAALIIYAVLLWGLFNAVPVTLTLPGIAGMILTIGVAADANVVIFERIKEEMRHGRTVRSAIAAGYSRGFRTILDASMLTLLTALVLFIFATSQPKGFALTLMIGVLVSIVTAVVATQALLGLLSDFEFFNRASFMGVRASDIVPDEPVVEARRPRRASTAARRKKR